MEHIAPASIKPPGFVSRVCHNGGVSKGATILHADLDAFYASVEQILHPELKGKAMAVGAGVILAASYEARAFGVRSAMPARRAKQLCPHLLIVAGEFARYTEFSEKVMEILQRFTPDIEQISVDEAFLDVSGSVHLFGEPPLIAAEMRKLVREEVGLAISIGVATTKHLAKVASQVAKPDGLAVVPEGEELEFLAPLNVRMIWGIGPATERKLTELGITTVGELAETDPRVLAKRLGRASAHHLHALANDRDPRPVKKRPKAKSVGSQQALGRGVTEPEEITEVVLGLAERVGSRLRKKDRAGSTITVRVRFWETGQDTPDNLTRSHTLGAPVGATDAINKVARRLVDDAIGTRTSPVTLIGISVSHLQESAAVQMELALDDEEAEDVARTGSSEADAAEAVDHQLDAIREKFGKDAVVRAGLLGREDHNAPDDFRKLAERD